jgi:hypothetical protein
MNQYFLELKLDEHPLENFYQYPDHLSKKTKSAYTYTAVHKGFIKSDILKIFQNSGLEFGGAVIFRKKPNQTSPLHVDILEEESKFIRCHCAVNWNLTFSKSYMAWYDTAEKECLPKYVSENKSKTDYLLTGIHYGSYGKLDIDSNKTKLLEKKEIYKPTLVRTDIPHQIVNQDTTDRWCLSIRFKENPSWETVCNSFKNILQ